MNPVIETIVNGLLREDFKIDNKRSTTDAVVLRNNSVLVAMAEKENTHAYSTMKGRIAIDNIEAFDKWSTCPVSIILPDKVGDIEWDRINDCINTIGTPAGFEMSNTFEKYDFDEIVKDG